MNNKKIKIKYNIGDYVLFYNKHDSKNQKNFGRHMIRKIHISEDEEGDLCVSYDLVRNYDYVKNIPENNIYENPDDLRDAISEHYNDLLATLHIEE